LFILLHLVYDFRVIKQTQYDRLSQQQPDFMLINLINVFNEDLVRGGTTKWKIRLY